MKPSRKIKSSVPEKKVPNKKGFPEQSNSFYSTIIRSFLENIYSLNNSKFFAGFVMLTMNIGSKYITIELSTTQEKYLKYTLGRQLLIFAILWMGTRDIVIALTLTLVFILFADYLFNENSKLCLIPEKYKHLHDVLDTNQDGVIDANEIKKAIETLRQAHATKLKKKGKSNIDDSELIKKLVKESFI